MKTAVFGLPWGAAAGAFIMSSHTHMECNVPDPGEYTQHRDVSEWKKSCGEARCQLIRGSEEVQLKRAQAQDTQAKSYHFNVVFGGAYPQRKSAQKSPLPQHASAYTTSFTTPKTRALAGLAHPHHSPKVSEGELSEARILASSSVVDTQVKPDGAQKALVEQNSCGSKEYHSISPVPSYPIQSMAADLTSTESQNGDPPEGDDIPDFTLRIDKNLKDERRKKFLERNRLAGMLYFSLSWGFSTDTTAQAYRCRQKKKLWVQDLEKRFEDATHSNLKLQHIVTHLKKELAELKYKNRHCRCKISTGSREEPEVMSLEVG